MTTIECETAISDNTWDTHHIHLTTYHAMYIFVSDRGREEEKRPNNRPAPTSPTNAGWVMPY